MTLSSVISWCMYWDASPSSPSVLDCLYQIPHVTLCKLGIWKVTYPNDMGAQQLSSGNIWDDTCWRRTFVAGGTKAFLHPTARRTRTFFQCWYEHMSHSCLSCFTHVTHGSRVSFMSHTSLNCNLPTRNRICFGTINTNTHTRRWHSKWSLNNQIRKVSCLFKVSFQCKKTCTD